MIKINIAEAKIHLSQYLKRVEAGETIILSRHSQPVAEIRPLSKAPGGPRPFGLCKGKFMVPQDFNAPLPREVISDFEGA
jgi:prevent-host-death family protein